MSDAGHLPLNIKNGGRDGLPSGKPLHHLRRTDDNNDILRLVSDNLLQSVEQTTSDPNAVGVRRRHTLPGLLAVLIRLRLAILTRLQEGTWTHKHLITFHTL